jgi:putative flippase GtrA
LTERERGIRYLLVGVWNTIFGYGVFALLQLTLGDSINYVILLAIAQVIGTLNAFVGYRLLVFRVHGNLLRDLARFSTVYVGAFVVNLALLPLLVEVVGLPVLIAQALVVGGTVVASFFVHRGFSFRRPEVPADIGEVDLP